MAIDQPVSVEPVCLVQAVVFASIVSPDDAGDGAASALAGGRQDCAAQSPAIFGDLGGALVSGLVGLCAQTVSGAHTHQSLAVHLG